MPTIYWDKLARELRQKAGMCARQYVSYFASPPPSPRDGGASASGPPTKVSAPGNARKRKVGDMEAKTEPKSEEEEEEERKVGDFLVWDHDKTEEATRRIRVKRTMAIR